MKGFYHIWAWRPSWSCDQDIANKITMPLPKEASHKISTRSAKRFQRRRSLKLWTMDDGRMDGRTDAGSWPSYKLTLCAFGSGELTRSQILFKVFFHWPLEKKLAVAENISQECSNIKMDSNKRHEKSCSLSFFSLPRH